ncbi:MAG: hypothetical protein FJZ56_07670, partial [Chlamydiae bacterium]|nr:hypothetical protein [Chlamydiota bacterium]
MEEINIIPLPVEKLNLEDSDLPDCSFRSLLEEEEEAIETMTIPSSCISPMQMIQTVEKEKRAEAIKTIIPVLAREISISMEHLKDSGMLEMKWEIQTPDLQEIEIYVRHFDTAPDT